MWAFRCHREWGWKSWRIAQGKPGHPPYDEPGYEVRKQTVEPVFGIIKSVLGFCQFLLRGLEQVSGEWRLICLAWNLKRMAVLRLQT